MVGCSESETASGSAPQPSLLLDRAQTMTTMRWLEIRRGAQRSVVGLKLELENPTGSVKYRTALSLLGELDQRRHLEPGTTVVESTSGNLGIALAGLTAEIGCRFVAVVDPKLPSGAREAMASAGAELVTVQERDRHGGYLLTRLQRVAELCAGDSSMVWANQYGSSANPAVHQAVTGPEISLQTEGRLGLVAVPVSTGGTLAGLSAFLRRSFPRVRILAVDVVGSIALSGVGRPHLLNGIGSTRRSSFLNRADYDRQLRVRDIEALAMCRLLAAETGLVLGGSSGAVVAAYVQEPWQHGGDRGIPVLFCPDGGERYEDTVYNDDWLGHKLVRADVEDVMLRAHRDGLRFSLIEDVMRRD